MVFTKYISTEDAKMDSYSEYGVVWQKLRPGVYLNAGFEPPFVEETPPPAPRRKFLGIF